MFKSWMTLMVYKLTLSSYSLKETQLMCSAINSAISLTEVTGNGLPV